VLTLASDLIGSVFEGGSVMKDESVTVVSSAFRISLSSSFSFRRVPLVSGGDVRTERSMSISGVERNLGDVRYLSSPVSPAEGYSCQQDLFLWVCKYSWSDRAHKQT